MTAIFTFPQSQTLRFINLNKSTDLQNFDNRFANRLKYPHTLPYHYCQTIEQTDNLWFQFRTNYENFTIAIVNAETDVRTDITSLAELQYTDSSDRKYYNVFPDVTALNGYYFFEIYGSDNDKSTVTFQSEIIKIVEEFKNSILLEWIGNYSYDDKMHWTDYKQFLRVEGSDRDITADQNKTIYQNTDYAPINLKSKPLRICSIKINLVSDWIGEKINLALSHDEFYCNEIRYNLEDLFEQTILTDSRMQTIVIEATQIDFEDGTDEEITGGEIIGAYLLYNDTEFYIIDDSESLIKINN